MTEDRSRTIDPARSRSKFRFRVRVGSAEMSFSEVTGLGLDARPIEFRAGNRAGFTPIKIASLEKSGAVVLKRGVLRSDPSVLGWLQQAGRGLAERKTVTVSLIDEAGHPMQTWTLTAAFPTKFASADLKASANDIAVETLELSYEGLSVNET